MNTSENSHEPTANETEYALRGTGCNNIGELRMALDILRDTLFVNHNDSWDPTRVARAVSQRMYSVQKTENKRQMSFDWRND
jgi:hypothetical protein